MAFELPVYFQSDYQHGQQRLPDVIFWVKDEEANAIIGCAIFHFNGQVACSQQYAPFGSYHGQHLEPQLGQEFLSFMEQHMILAGMTQVQFRHPTVIYQSTEWLNLLKDNGYLISQIVSHYVTVNHQSYLMKMHPMERRRLKKCSGFIFRWISLLRFEEIYRFISECRSSRNRHLSLDLPTFKKIVSHAPDGFLLAAVYCDKEMVAATILVKVKKNIWYNFYPASKLQYQQHSPMVFLINALYHQAQRYGIQYIDLGNSQVAGDMKHSLAQFKFRMGGQLSHQYFCQKVL